MMNNTAEFQAFIHLKFQQIKILEFDIGTHLKIISNYKNAPSI